ncbi:Yip1 family protein [Metabacillus herbersteinensis]|uniref:Yip1 family protein n=1 Tax=Metabacillus herbersteinensis TaxID=283816 RepID=A0ABV6GAR2_9BACI
MKNTNHTTETTAKPSLIGMFLSPTLQFDRMRERPTIWLPLIIVTVIGVITGLLVATGMGDAALEDLGLSGAEAQTAQMFTMLLAGIGSLIFIPVGFLIYSLILLAIIKIAGSEATFKQLFSLTIFTTFITTIGQLLNAIINLSLGSDSVYFVTGLNSLVGAEGALGGFLNTIEVFSIWGYVLIGMGLHKVAQLSKPASIIIAIIFFVLACIMAAAGGALEGMSQF